MKHVLYAEKSLLMRDETAETVVEYARVLSDHGRADTVTVQAVGSEGKHVEVTMLLSAATSLVIQTTDIDVPMPRDTAAIERMREETRRFTTPMRARPEEVGSFDLDLGDLGDPRTGI